MSTANWKVERLAGAIGAEIFGVDLSRPLDAAERAALRALWLEHGVIFFRDQPLSSAQFLAFAEGWGTPVEYPFVKGLADYPVIIEIKKLEHEKVNFGGVWHSDTAYLERPPMATLLLAREVPPYGSDTLFANQYLAYETLSEGMKKLLDGLDAVNTSAKADTTRTREDRLAEVGRSDAASQYEATHPVVRTHPETGRKALYVNYAHTARFAGMTEEESAPLLQWLFAHQKKEEFTCRFRWRVGSLALWDNRCTHHSPVNDYHGFRRVLHRITLAGDKPRR
ncbi:TauD/TfdA dioxygenase family protein [Extensimonas vulgaris]|uniref:Taurine dioxygenase n=1 Tax=Extensimonas vulgaris TaxID=1031594 RepID=A0A369AJ76_9BURK|nr:TauD/TfdA family dioxygenase [Extensimonas vulgaris]RCX09432.1 taurine dioxygenase [Extensimonas vulgaris]TWI38562.1 taurine dioxygenase [Extensimonas vulgaris]TXD14579.1 taurine dioxygenase [Extensimonas vulgaris]